MAPDLATLSWCIGDIRDCLSRAERLVDEQLERESHDDPQAQVEAAAQGALLAQARVLVHQAYGALQVVSIDGVSLLARETEKVIEAVLAGEVAFDASTARVLKRGFQAVTEYCDGLLQGIASQPLHLFPYYRDLLTARKAERIDPGDLFFPDLTVQVPANPLSADIDAPQMLAHAHGMFEKGLLGLMRGGIAEGASAMRDAVAMVSASALASRDRSFWWVAHAFFEALVDGTLKPDVETKRLLARFNLQLRKSIQQRAELAERLFTDMLFALACVPQASEVVRQVREVFGIEALSEADLEVARYDRIDEQVLATARNALERARQSLEKTCHGNPAELAVFSAAIDDFAKISEQLPAQGLHQLARGFLQVRDVLNGRQTVPAERFALEIAIAILFAEQSVAEGARQGSIGDQYGADMADRLVSMFAIGGADHGAVPQWLQDLSLAALERRTMTAFVTEVQEELRAVEKDIDAFFRDAQHRDSLARGVKVLRQIAGAMSLIGLDDVAEGAQSIADRVAAFEGAGGAPDERQAQNVATNIGALSFFIDSLLHPEQLSGSFGFDRASGEFRMDVTGAQSRTGQRVREAKARPGAVAAKMLEPLRAQTLVLAPSAASTQASAATGATSPQATPTADATPASEVTPAPEVTPHAQPVPLSEGVPAFELLLRTETAIEPQLERVDWVGTHHAEQPQEPSASTDSELLEIFLTEAAEVLDNVTQGAMLLRHDPTQMEHLATIRRGFHTLKGSSRMVGLERFGQAAWALEDLLNQWLAEGHAVNEALNDLVDEALVQMSAWIALLVGNARAERVIDPEPLLEATKVLHSIEFGGEPIGAEVLPVSNAQIEIEEAQSPAEVHEADETDNETIEIGSAADSQDSLDIQEAVAPDETIEIGDTQVSRPLYLIFLAEADGLIEMLCADAAQWRQQPGRGATEPAIRAAHSLAGSSAIMSLTQVQQLAKLLENAMLARQGSGAEVAVEDLDTLIHVADRIRSMLHQYAGGMLPKDEPQVLEMAQALHARWTAPEKTAPAPVPAEPELLLTEQEFEFELPPQQEQFEEAVLIDVPGGFEAADLEPRVVIDSRGAARPPVQAELPGEIPEQLSQETADVMALSSADDDESTQPISTVAIPLPADEIDDELLPIFVEEASDHLPQIGENLRRWVAHPDDRGHAHTLMRQLHTVKGSARMAGALALGQMLHEIETRIEALLTLPSVSVAQVDELISDHDQAVALFEKLRARAHGMAAELAQAMIEEGLVPTPMESELPTIQESVAQLTEETDSTARALQTDEPGQQTAVPERMAPAPGAEVDRRSQPLIRVRADLLDRLVNEAGEVSIARSRLDNELSGLRQSMGELIENVNRLRSHLREIEIQAETQIQTRIAQQKEHDRAFDPLEFDRYTRFQELARMLAESVNDVATVQQNAVRSLEDASQDLYRQGHVLRDLQQNLMRVRMVRFGSVSDRLYRVVRQTARELDKLVHLEIRGAGVELDRSILERMVGPIEHLLRNAVTHGIEPSQARLAAGKEEIGQLSIEVRQEGRDVQMIFADDGAGLDLARIREKAVIAGLLSAQDAPTDRALADLIFMPGITTAAQVTEIAGRGVGMDVVRSEVAGLGGRIETQTHPGKGTSFRIVLPLTLAVSQVVLTSAGRARYAISSSSVEEVLQLKPQVLAAAHERRSLEWHDERVPIYYLGTLVELSDVSPSAQHHAPVLIIRSGSQRIALHCDEVTPNQDVVVKGVGAQVSRIRGITGATVLGTGEVVLIINPVAFAQPTAGMLLQRTLDEPAISAMLADSQPPLVMVVDDSLTVRKVTQRLLQREGYRVVLARDGVDALRLMPEETPDVMLVDIEMPRMDGFDLTRNIRRDSRYAKIPIIMITSRTASKHRDFAKSLGVNVYLGKPYAEDELLRHVAGLTARRSSVATSPTR
jgi:chemosensory pili system protein ChpA (sensor histidine kinase/response regulator)